MNIVHNALQPATVPDIENDYINLVLAKIKNQISLTWSYTALAAIAMLELKLIQNMNPGRLIYFVCGPLSTGGRGNFSDNLDEHIGTIEHLRKLGLIVWSQEPYEERLNLIKSFELWEQYPNYDRNLLEQFYLPLFLSRLLSVAVFRKGWHESRGAVWEREKLTELDITMFDLDDITYMIEKKP